ncbi:caspase family protein [Bradyrhizobium sp. Gha]|uniref:caspase family protein n=1 Tax=Bradyrhizobium sp. Gha TaxID=1855318 RepID=UPI0008EC7867|nr:caspase family protein [Bradyrhizobium sp. Gha]SFI60885.1 Caspase domain-containing protein [Bradyrhizobium sp. Gha]
MSRRALIIGIEDYVDVQDGSIGPKLPGTREAALAFRDWLSAKWNAEHIAQTDRQIVFCSEPIVPDGRPAKLDDINQALLDIRAAGQDSTDEFFFFFSGHGFTFVSAGARADQLIAANYRSMELSGASACLHLDKMIYWLRQELGPGKQYYFVDACRNELDGTKIAGATFGLPNNPQTTGEAMTFLLQSTVPAATAAADGRFPRELIEGLKGRSIAKTWDEVDDDAMLVRYDTLRIYVTGRLKDQPMYNKVEGAGGEADGIIARFKPAPTTNCVVRIEGATEPVKGFVVMNGRRTGHFRVALTGDVTDLVVKPDRYTMSVDLQNTKVRDNDRTILLFEDNDVTFHVGNLPTLEVASGPDLSDVLVPPQTSIELRELNTGERQIFGRDAVGALPKGRYAATMRDRDSILVSSRILDVEGGKSVNLTDWTQKTAQASIAASGFPVDGGAVDFSESLGGPLADPDLNVWLAVLGAGRIMNGIFGRYYSKIGALPLHDFRQEMPGASPLYVLAGFDDAGLELKVSVWKPGAVPSWLPAHQPAGLDGVRELYVPISTGPQLVSFEVSGQAAYTVASLSSPNRATLFTLTLDEIGTPVLAQYLLPLGEQVGQLHPFVAERLRFRNPLADVKSLAQAMRAFRNRRDIRETMTSQLLDEILYMKWVDPIATALSAYELIRRGERGSLAEVANNLTTYFPDFPDGAALARLAGISKPDFEAIPLFLDGLRAYDDLESRLPIPAARLDYSSPWTAWRGVPAAR